MEVKNKICDRIYNPILLFILIANTVIYLSKGNFLFGGKGYIFQLFSLSLLLFSTIKNKKFAINIFTGLFIFYLSFPNPTPSNDMVPARFAPYWLDNDKNFSFRSILGDENFKIYSSNELEPYEKQIIELPHQHKNGYLLLPYYLVYTNGEFLPSYPLITIGLHYYLYTFIYSWFVDLPDMNSDNWMILLLPSLFRMEKTSAAFFAALSSFILFYILISKPFSLSNKSSFILVIIYSISTSHFSTSSQALWQHGIIEFIFLLITFILVSLQSEKVYKYLWVGILLAILFFSRPNSIILAILPISYWLFNNSRKDWIMKFGSLFAGFIFAFNILAYINIVLYDHFLGGYIHMKKAKEILGYLNLFSNDYFKGFFSLLFSPNFGYFVFSPVLILGCWALLRKKMRLFSLLSIFIIFVYISFYSKYIFWEGGHSFGARFLTDLNPIFIFLLAIIFPYLKMKPSLWKIFIVSSMLGFIFQYMGAHYKNEISVWNSCVYENVYKKAWDYNNLVLYFPFSAMSCNH